MLHINTHRLSSALCLWLGTFLLTQPASSQSFSGTYTINSLATGKVLDGDQSSVYALGANNGANQTWLLQATEVVAQGRTTYTVRSAGTGNCLDGDGGRLYPSACNGGNFQKWIITSADVSGYYVLTSVATGKVLDSDGQRVYPSDRNGGNFQKWQLTSTGRRTYPALQGRTDMPTQIGTAVSTAPPARNTAPPAYPETPVAASQGMTTQQTFGKIYGEYVLRLGRIIYSPNHHYQLTLQADGNLVVYKLRGNDAVVATWGSGTNGKAVEKAIFQADGNLVLYGYDKRPVWASNTNGKGRYLFLQDDGNLVIYNQYNAAIWATNTNE